MSDDFPVPKPPFVLWLCTLQLSTALIADGKVCLKHLQKPGSPLIHEALVLAFTLSL